MWNQVKTKKANTVRETAVMFMTAALLPGLVIAGSTTNKGANPNGKRFMEFVGCCDSTSRKEWTCRTFIRTGSMPLREGSTNDREKRYNFTRRPKNLVNVLCRPIETATESRPSFCLNLDGLNVR